MHCFIYMQFKIFEDLRHKFSHDLKLKQKYKYFWTLYLTISIYDIVLCRFYLEMSNLLSKNKNNEQIWKLKRWQCIICMRLFSTIYTQFWMHTSSICHRYHLRPVISVTYIACSILSLSKVTNITGRSEENVYWKNLWQNVHKYLLFCL